LKLSDIPKAELIPDFEAVGPEAALGPLAGAVGRAVAGVVSLGPLNRVDEFGLFQIGRINTEALGLAFYLSHCYWSFKCLYQSHVYLLY
jgi:hypothetical protein